ncbi:uncharacterized protein [Aegilops tauschii subsp. strangulata]|uniref:uncharacterized protein n=1 Tax=Aegilops tauschii subsp. strangulata TaxID=200361 RepID=UPI003CC8714D
MTALILVLDGKTTSPAIISEELRHLFNPDWDWEVTPISDREFTTIFPDPVGLRYGTHNARLTLALNQLSVRILVPSVDPLAVATLSTVWVQIHEHPPPARDEGIIRGLSRLLGKFVAVDDASLPKGPAVRMQIKSPDPAKLKMTIRMFFNDVGYDLRIPGFGHDGRRRLLTEYMRDESIDVVEIQEIVRTEFSLVELERLSRHLFVWHWLPSSGVTGHSGGILLGVKDATFQVGSMDRGSHFVNIEVWERDMNFKWEIIVVYGLADHSRSTAFLAELHAKIASATLPIVVGGDFNLLRSAEEKSNSRVDLAEIRRFNDWVADLGLLELDRVGARFTWTNRQGFGHDGRRRLLIEYMRDESIDVVEIRETMHTEFSLIELERLSRHLFAWHWLPSSGVTGHSSGILLGVKDATFQVGSMDRGSHFVSIEVWEHDMNFKWEIIVVYGPADHSCSAAFLAELLAKIAPATLPVVVGGDFNLLCSAEEKSNSRVDLAEIHRCNDWVADLGLLELDRVGARFTWTNRQENAALLAPFDATEVEAFVKAMNPASAPGPDGLPVHFFQAFWPMVKEIILDLFREFSRGTLDMSRLNYGIISLIPKVPGAADIRQFRPITILNVIFRILAKGYATRAALIAPRIHHPNQSAFTKGRYIVDGILVLYEVIHEVKSKHLRVVFFKIDFHKAYDTVHWSFLWEVLLKHGFHSHWVARVMQLVTSGRTAVNINGEIGPYFMIGQGAGHIRGICPHLVANGGLTHLQYADDTIIMVEGLDEDIQNLKFLLLCFQEISGLTINFAKSEVMVLG